MPFALAGLLIGAIWGARRARKRGGQRADVIQWAIVHGLILAMAGLFAALIIVRVAG